MLPLFNVHKVERWVLAYILVDSFFSARLIRVLKILYPCGLLLNWICRVPEEATLRSTDALALWEFVSSN